MQGYIPDDKPNIAFGICSFLLPSVFYFIFIFDYGVSWNEFVPIFQMSLNKRLVVFQTERMGYNNLFLAVAYVNSSFHDPIQSCQFSQYFLSENYKFRVQWMFKSFSRSLASLGYTSSISTQMHINECCHGVNWLFQKN